MATKTEVNTEIRKTQTGTRADIYQCDDCTGTFVQNSSPKHLSLLSVPENAISRELCGACYQAASASRNASQLKTTQGYITAFTQFRAELEKEITSLRSLVASNNSSGNRQLAVELQGKLNITMGHLATFTGFATECLK